ncbi:MAG: 2-amino-4-oxopentanoate thiolase subunit OrtA [Lachnospiraceae bacterium]
MIKKNTWVLLRRVVLPVEERVTGIPEDTASTPLVLWVKGKLCDDSNIGDQAEVRTNTGRIERGILEDAHPQYNLSYGSFMPELIDIGPQAREILFGGDDNK